MEGSPSLVARTASLIPVKTSPYERDYVAAQAARIRAMYLDKTEKTVRRANVGEDDSMRAKILRMSLFPNIYNKKTVMRYM